MSEMTFNNIPDPRNIELPKVKSMDQMLAEAKKENKPEMAARIARVQEAMVKADEDYARMLEALAAKYNKFNK